MNPYEVLGVSPSASDGELHRAYVRLARRWHPDLNDGSAEAEDRMRELNEAWAVLGEPSARARFDRSRPDPGFVPDDPVDDDFDPRTVPDTPYRPATGVQARWGAWSSAPVALFVAGAVVVVFGFFFDSTAMIGVGVGLISMACVGIALLMLTVLVGARRDEG